MPPDRIARATEIAEEAAEHTIITTGCPNRSAQTFASIFEEALRANKAN